MDSKFFVFSPLHFYFSSCSCSLPGVLEELVHVLVLLVLQHAAAGVAQQEVLLEALAQRLGQVGDTEQRKGEGRTR